MLDSGYPIRIPVGAETLGRIINVIGEPIDERGPIPTDKLAPIHADAPEFVEMSVEQEILVTGIKVVDLLAPYAKGGKIGKTYIEIEFELWKLKTKRESDFLMTLKLSIIHVNVRYLRIVLISCRSIRWCWCRQNCTYHGID